MLLVLRIDWDWSVQRQHHPGGGRKISMYATIPLSELLGSARFLAGPTLNIMIILIFNM
jgi:hypothetical protein